MARRSKQPCLVGPNGEVRPEYVVANAVHVMRVATGQAEEAYARKPRPRRKRRKETTVSSTRVGSGQDQYATKMAASSPWSSAD